MGRVAPESGFWFFRVSAARRVAAVAARADFAVSLDTARGVRPTQVAISCSLCHSPPRATLLFSVLFLSYLFFLSMRITCPPFVSVKPGGPSPAPSPAPAARSSQHQCLMFRLFSLACQLLKAKWSAALALSRHFSLFVCVPLRLLAC